MKAAFLRLVGLLLCLAAVPKLRHPEDFLAALNSYQVFPEWIQPALVFNLPALEMVVGLALLLWVSRGGLLWAAMLFSAFSLVLGWARWHGLTLTCGCFGSLEHWLHQLPHGLDLHLLATTLLALTLSRWAWLSSGVHQGAVSWSLRGQASFPSAATAQRQPSAKS